jgi:hypothetical protein
MADILQWKSLPFYLLREPGKVDDESRLTRTSVEPIEIQGKDTGHFLSTPKQSELMYHSRTPSNNKEAACCVPAIEFQRSDMGKAETDAGRFSWPIIIIVIAELLCTSLWFSGNSTTDALRALWGLGDAGIGWLTNATQFGFIIGTLALARHAVRNMWAVRLPYKTASVSPSRSFQSGLPRAFMPALAPMYHGFCCLDR